MGVGHTSHGVAGSFGRKGQYLGSNNNADREPLTVLGAAASYRLDVVLDLLSLGNTANGHIIIKEPCIYNA